MLRCFTRQLEKTAIPITFISEDQLTKWQSQQDGRLQSWIKSIDFKAKFGAVSYYGGADGGLEQVLVGLGNTQDWRVLGQLPATLPLGTYYIADEQQFDQEQRYQLYLAWAMGSYQFTPYKKLPPLEAKLFLPEHAVDETYLEAVARAIYLVRDLINTPADDMMPSDLAEAAISLADQFSAKVTQVIGDDLLKQNYPTIHAVGRASAHASRLIDLRWGQNQHPKVTLVGKGVCFDSGGLDLKNASNMALMKKDMAGGAHALGLAHIIMALRLPVNLRVLIPAVENALSGDAFHPGDVIVTRKSTTVEVTNTDAEGRLILANALYAAAVDNPDLLLDFTTLTGAARVALGTEIAAMFSPDDQLITELMACAKTENDPIWSLPLFMPYRKLLDSKIADMTNSASSPYAGAITAAVFMKEFVADNIAWAHFDMMAWNVQTKPGMPEGGEAQTLRAVARYLVRRFG